MGYPDNKVTFPVRVIEDLVPALDYNGQNDLLDEMQEAFGYGSLFMHISASINPSVTSTYDLGTNLLRWDNLYVDDTIYSDVYSNIESDILFEIDGATKMILLENGNLGIGLAGSPTAKLEVQGTIGQTNNSSLSQKDTGGSFREILRYDFADKFKLCNGVQGNVLFSPVGNIGIGIDPPTEKLHINGEIKIDNASEGVIVKTPDGTKSYRIRVDNAGAVVTDLV